MKTEKIDYINGNETFEGYFAFDETVSEKRPCVLVFHAWGGQSDYERELCKQMVALGYSGFAVDIYGKGRRGDPFQGNEHLMDPFLQDRLKLQKHALAALKNAQELPQVDANRIAALGLCFGGLCVLDLARSGTQDIRGVVSIHGGLAPSGLPAETITAKVLILHGYDDPMAPTEAVLAIADELTLAGSDWQIHAYGHTMHAFSVPQANLPEAGIMFNERAAHRSWQSMVNFFEEIF